MSERSEQKIFFELLCAESRIASFRQSALGLLDELNTPLTIYRVAQKNWSTLLYSF